MRNDQEPQQTQHPIIVFDGTCNLCSRTVQFIIRRDSRSIFRFAAAQSPEGEALLDRYDLGIKDTGTVLLIDGGLVTHKSDAVLGILEQLTGWQFVASLLRYVPRVLRDWMYDYVATHRISWFGRRDTCLIPSDEIRERFLSSLDR